MMVIWVVMPARVGAGIQPEGVDNPPNESEGSYRTGHEGSMRGVRDPIVREVSEGSYCKVVGVGGGVASDNIWPK